jgi:CPA1 family monovalent cation:H+ antiporter
MNTLEIISVLIATAALFGWISSRVLRIPITGGTMVLTVLTTMSLGILGRRAEVSIGLSISSGASILRV